MVPESPYQNADARRGFLWGIRLKINNAFLCKKPEKLTVSRLGGEAALILGAQVQTWRRGSHATRIWISANLDPTAHQAQETTMIIFKARPVLQTRRGAVSLHMPPQNPGANTPRGDLQMFCTDYSTIFVPVRRCSKPGYEPWTPHRTNDPRTGTPANFRDHET